MFKHLLAWLRRKEAEPIEGATVYETLLNHLGDIDEINTREFLVPRTRATRLDTATDNLEELSDYLIEATVFISKGQAFPERWRNRVLQYESRTLESFISDASDLIHPLDWIIQHRHYIVKLLDAFLLMDSADRDYYQRKCNFVVEDLLALIKASRECLR